MAVGPEGRYRAALAGAVTAIALAVALVVAVGSPALAATAPGTFSGTCSFSGPITPDPPITVIPKSGSHFSYRGTGTCSGTLNGTAVNTAPLTLAFTNASTLFDTCEFGPDVNLDGQLTIGSTVNEASFAVTIDLARLALVGPFELIAAGGGRASGTATFMPSSTTAGVQDCASSGIGAATLAGTFTTSAALAGQVGAPTTTSTSTTTATAPSTTTIASGPGPSCLAVHRVVLRFAAIPGQRITRAVVYLDGRRVRTVTGRRLTSVTLTGLTSGLHRVKLITHSNRGRRRTTSRRVRICA